MPRAFELWRRWLSRRVFALSGRVRGQLERKGGIALSEASTTRFFESESDARWLVAAIAALAIGGAGRVGLAAGGSPRLEALLAVSSAIVLACLRLTLLSAWIRRGHGPAWVALSAWSRGTVVWAVAVDPALSAVAWAASAFIGYRVLTSRGVPAALSRTGIAVAWGTHAAAVILIWLAANAWVAFIAG